MGGPALSLFLFCPWLDLSTSSQACVQHLHMLKIKFVSLDRSLSWWKHDWSAARQKPERSVHSSALMTFWKSSKLLRCFLSVSNLHFVLVHSRLLLLVHSCPLLFFFFFCCCLHVLFFFWCIPMPIKMLGKETFSMHSRIPSAGHGISCKSMVCMCVCETPIESLSTTPLNKWAVAIHTGWLDPAPMSQVCLRSLKRQGRKAIHCQKNKSTAVLF